MNEELERKIIKVPDGEICDYIDGKFRRDTPEEYVRQTIEKRLINEHKYKPDRIKIEFGLKLGSSRPRADIVVFSKDSTQLTQDYVWLIVECKNEKVEPKNKKDGVEQLKSYMSACPNCEWGMWTNGRYKEVLRKIKIEGKYEFQEYNDIPPADGSLEDVDRPKRNRLKKAFDDNLLMVFKTCHNHIYVTDGLQKQPAFFEFLKLIFCKTLDEQNVGKPLEFFATSNERSNPDGQLTVKNRISKIFEKVKKQFPQIFDLNDEINLQPRSLSWIVSELQQYSLLETHVDVKGKAYEELVGAYLRGDRGEFFTPRNIMRMAVEMINPLPDEKVFDPACGTGGFLVTAMNHVIEKLKLEVEKDFGKNESEWSDSEKGIVRDRIKEIALSNFFGFDINPDLVKATKMNMVMNNDGSGNIYRNDSLLPPHEWSGKLKQQFAKSLNVDPNSIKNYNSIEFFDVIVTNPPFGSKIPIKDSHILEQFSIGYIWRNKQLDKSEQKEWAISSDFQSSVPPEQLFIERCLQFLKPGGRLAIVLPDSILGNPGLGYIRQWLIEKTRIVASIDLHVDTFQPRNGTQTSILLVQKKTKKEIEIEQQTGKIKPYNIFMAMVEKVGHDKRGNTLFKRDEHGNEIWVPEEQNVLEINTSAIGDINVKAESKVRVIDDQSREVPAVFAKWKNQEGLSW
ncbi:MAG: N-6 DNA methylase [Candidatus Thermoplasmatota archaeon]|nr:N-6 DNA methylase [Candidatus Thermoplasmatota archaeon]